VASIIGIIGGMLVSMPPYYYQQFYSKNTTDSEASS